MLAPVGKIHIELKLMTLLLMGCTMFVTLEPYPMCTGAIIMARIPTLVFGAREARTGSCGSVIDLFAERYGHFSQMSLLMRAPPSCGSFYGKKIVLTRYCNATISNEFRQKKLLTRRGRCAILYITCRSRGLFLCALLRRQGGNAGASG